MIDEELELLEEENELSLLETLDHVLNRGLVIAGEITISVADIDMIFLGLNVLLSSVETAQQEIHHRLRHEVFERLAIGREVVTLDDGLMPPLRQRDEYRRMTAVIHKFRADHYPAANDLFPRG